jgi:hypothetical protein
LELVVLHLVRIRILSLWELVRLDQKNFYFFSIL